MESARGSAWLLLLATPPAVLLAVFYGLVGATRLELGYWPHYGTPDAGVTDAVPFPALHVVVFVLFVVALVSGPIGVVAGTLSFRRSSRLLWHYSLALVATWLLAAALVVLDPGGFFDWYFD